MTAGTRTVSLKKREEDFNKKSAQKPNTNTLSNSLSLQNGTAKTKGSAQSLTDRLKSREKVNRENDC